MYPAQLVAVGRLKQKKREDLADTVDMAAALIVCPDTGVCRKIRLEHGRVWVALFGVMCARSGEGARATGGGKTR